MRHLPQYDAYSIETKTIYCDDDFNCRNEYVGLSLADLTKSIKAKGLEFPVVVQPRRDASKRIPAGYSWGLIAGFRRFKAATQYLKWDKIPATIRKGLTDTEAHFLNFTENLERKDLSPLEEAIWIGKQYSADVTIGQISDELHRDRGWVSRRRRLLEAPLEVQELVHRRAITLTDLTDIVLKRTTPEDQIRVANALASVKHQRGKPRRIRVDGQLLQRSFRRLRNKTEIGEKIKMMLNRAVDPMVTKAMAWCAGFVSDAEIDELIDAQPVIKPPSASQ